MGSNGHVQFDPAVIKQARQIDLLSYLQRYEPSNLKRVAGNVYCTRKHDSLKISNGKWYWWSRGFGGYSALDYLIKGKEYDFVEAVKILTGQTMADWKPPPAPKKKAGQYIPFCTRMVSLKYYTPSADNQLHFWGHADRVAYVDAMNTVLVNYLEEPIVLEKEEE